MAVRNKELQGWNDFSKILYYFERKMDKFSVVAALFYYIHLGRLHLRIGPLVEQVGRSEPDDFFENLTVKRRVMYWDVLRRVKGIDKDKVLLATQVCFVEDYIDDTLLQNLVFKASSFLDSYTFDQALAVGLCFKYFGLPADDPFFELLAAVLLDLADADLPLADQQDYTSIFETHFPTFELPKRPPQAGRQSSTDIISAAEVSRITLERAAGRRQQTKSDFYSAFVDY